MSDPNTPPPTPPPATPLNYAAALPPGYVETDPNQRTLAMIAHLLGFAGGFIGPLILYLIKKDDPSTGPFAKDQMKEVLNWQFTVLIGLIVSAMLIIVLIGLILYPAIIVLSIVYMILNAIKANKGEVARYLWSIKFFK